MGTKWLVCVSVLMTGSVCSGQLPSTDGINLIYSPDTGDVMVESLAGPMTTFELKSASAAFSRET